MLDDEELDQFADDTKSTGTRLAVVFWLAIAGAVAIVGLAVWGLWSWLG